MTLPPLPIRTRAYDGEGVDSYAHRAAARNYTTVKDTEDWLRRLGVLHGKDRRDPARKQAWRQLGALHDTAFTAPDILGGDWVTERELCHRCAPTVAYTTFLPRPRPEDAPDTWKPDMTTEPPTVNHLSAPARGRLPGVGRVCLRHRRWIDGPQVDVTGRRDILRAERRYRQVLAPRHVLFDSPVMREAAQVAAVSADPSRVADLQQTTGLPLSAVLYPEQVAFAVLMCSPAFLRMVGCTGPRPDLVALIDTVIGQTVPVTADAQPYRARSRLLAFANRLDRFVWNARAKDADPDDGAYNVLRLLDETD